MSIASPQRTLLDQNEAAARLGLKNPRTLAVWRQRRCGPPYLLIGKRLVRYDEETLLAWVSKRDA